MAEAVTGTIIGGLFTEAVYSQLMRRNLDPMSVWNGLVNRKWEGEIKAKGDKVVIRQAGNVTIKNYVKGVDMEFENPEGNHLTLEIDQLKYFGFYLDDVDIKQSDIKDLGEMYVARGQQAITEDKDLYIATKILDGIAEKNTLDSLALTKDNAYNALTRLRAKLAWSRVLKQNGTGFDGKRPWLVVDPDVMGVLSEAPQAIKATEAGDKVTREGTILRLAGFDIKESNITDPAAGTRNIIAGTTEAFTYADQITNTKVTRAEKRFGYYHAGEYLYGGRVVEENALALLPVTLTV